MLVYLAAPLFSAAEKRFNEGLAEKLEAAGFRVFLPQRDGVARDRPPYGEMAAEERHLSTFQLDEAKIFESDVFCIVVDGRVPDEGACVELGIAYCQKKLREPGKLLVGLQTDVRAALPRLQAQPDAARAVGACSREPGGSAEVPTEPLRTERD